MNSPPAIYFSLWGTLLLAWIGLSYKYVEKWNESLVYLGDEIRSFNAPRYDQSVGRRELARDLRSPWRSANLQKFADNNGITFHRYLAELREHIEDPQRIYWAGIFHAAGVIYALSGITYLLPGGFIPPTIYIGSAYLLFSISLLLFWLI